MPYECRRRRRKVSEQAARFWPKAFVFRRPFTRRAATLSALAFAFFPSRGLNKQNHLALMRSSELRLGADSIWRLALEQTRTKEQKNISAGVGQLVADTAAVDP